MKTYVRPITADWARKLSLRLCATLGTPESAAWSHDSHWHTEITWRFRTNDGSAWSRLGFGPTRKMVTLATRDGVPSFMHVYIS
jgi:hypothetical protein